MSYAQFQYQDALKAAAAGKWQLPEFQRDFKWKIRQTILLFDSLRSEFPIGSLLLANSEAFGHYRPFSFAEKDASNGSTNPDYLVLDGQQRITAGIQLFYPNQETQATHYFINLSKVSETLSTWLKASGRSIKDDEAIIEFADTCLEADDGYLVAKTNVKETWSLFIKSKLVYTPYLLDQNKFDVEKDKYLEKYPDDRRLLQVFNLIFRQNKNYNPVVGTIVVDQKDHRTLSRVFSTLNRTGTPLTPFEITVSEMFGQGVRLLDDIQVLQETIPYFNNLDPTKTIILQAALRLAGQDHKKANLPKTLKKETWERTKDDASVVLNQVGEFLVSIGCPVDETSKFIPYDSVLVPMSAALYQATKSKAAKKEINDVLGKFFFQSALSTRYTEGAHTKQLVDGENLIKAIQGQGFEVVETEFERKFVGLKGVGTSGAIGKAVLCFVNYQRPRDVVSSGELGLGKNNTQIHHIYPKKVLEGFVGITAKEKNAVANLMLLENETNRDFTVLPPGNQIEKCLKDNAGNFEDHYQRQFIDKKCLEIMKRSNPKLDDYKEFLEAREACIEKSFYEAFKIEAVKRSLNAEDLDDLDEFSD